MIDTSITEIDFDGVFRFTNATDEDYSHLWNNEEYFFPAGKTTPMIMPKENLESIQNIRKLFAYDLALREFYKSKDYKARVKIGRATPSVFDEKILEPWITECLKPLPIVKATMRKLKGDDHNYKASKAITKDDNPNFEFRNEAKEENIKSVGKMPDVMPSFN